MRQLLAGLSLGAIAVIAATAASSAQSMPPLTQAEIAALAQNPAINAAAVACSQDRWRLCAAVMPGGGRIVRCLVANADSLSSVCRSAMIEARKTIAAARGADFPPSAK